MKKILQNSIMKKILLILGAIIVFLLILNYLIMPWYVNSPEVVIPNVVGEDINQAKDKLKDANLDAVINDTIFDTRYPIGKVIMQTPKAGEIVKEGRNVYLVISGGVSYVETPRLIGKSLRDAKLNLERVGLKLGRIDELPSNNPADMIIAQEISPGTKVKKGEVINISVSLGQEAGNVEVPDLIGKSLNEAQMILSNAGLITGRINYQPSFTLLPNTVIDQYPSSGQKLKAGDKVDLFVTKDSEPPKEIYEEIK